MLINECQQALVQESENCIAEENGNEDTTQKFSLKIFVPTLDAYKYKSQVVSGLASRGNMSADRMIRVQPQTIQSKPMQPTLKGIWLDYLIM